jgi:hypothetical protein
MLFSRIASTRYFRYLSNGNISRSRLAVEQANVLVKIDDISLDVAQTIINIQRYKKLRGLGS